MPCHDIWSCWACNLSKRLLRQNLLFQRKINCGVKISRSWQTRKKLKRQGRIKSDYTPRRLDCISWLSAKRGQMLFDETFATLNAPCHGQRDRDRNKIPNSSGNILLSLSDHNLVTPQPIPSVYAGRISCRNRRTTLSKDIKKIMPTQCCVSPKGSSDTIREN